MENIGSETKTNDYDSYVFKHDHSELEDKYDYSKKRLKENNKKINFVVTHGGCTDGFMSATIVQMWMKDNGILTDPENVTFYDAYYGADFSKLPDLMKDKYVIICDF